MLLPVPALPTRPTAHRPPYSFPAVPSYTSSTARHMLKPPLGYRRLIRLPHCRHVARPRVQPQACTYVPLLLRPDRTNDLEKGPLPQATSARATAAAQSPQSTNEPCSLQPSQVANTGARRCRAASTLLQSPARAGHSACMRQIFDHSKPYPLGLQQSHHSTHPVLSNTARQVSPLRCNHTTTDSITTHDQSLPTPSNPTTNLPLSFQSHSPEEVTSRQPSESWSDDSQYLSVGLQYHSTHVAASPSERIYEWLQETGNGSPCGRALDLDED